MNDLTSAENIDYSCFPDNRGHFGIYGGRFVSETLISALDELAVMYKHLKADPIF